MIEQSTDFDSRSKERRSLCVAPMLRSLEGRLILVVARRRTILTGDGWACSFLAATAAGGGGAGAAGAAGCRPLVSDDAFFLSLSLSFFWRRNGKFFMVSGRNSLKAQATPHNKALSCF